jgi:hypothetical protein
MTGGIIEAIWKVKHLSLCVPFVILGFSVLTVLNLNEVDAMLTSTKIFSSVLFWVGGSAGGWQCC